MTSLANKSLFDPSHNTSNLMSPEPKKNNNKQQPSITEIRAAFAVTPLYSYILL